MLLVCMVGAAENALLTMGLGFFSASHRVAEMLCERQIRYQGNAKAGACRH